MFSIADLNNILPSYLTTLFIVYPTKHSLIAIAIGILVLIILLAIVYVYLRIIGLRKQIARKSVLLEIIPPSIANQSAFSTTQLFTILHSIESDTSFIEKLLQIKKRMSYEIVSSKEDGIRYLLYVPKEDESVVRKNLLAFLPGVEIHQVKDYVPAEFGSLKTSTYSITEFKYERSFVFPLLEQNILNKHDPIAYITGQMTQLKPDELLSLQIVTTPISTTFHSSITDYLHILRKGIYDGKGIVSYLQNDAFSSVLKILKNICIFLFDLSVMIMRDISTWFMELFGSAPNTPQKQISSQDRTTGTINELTPKQKQVQKLVEDKINQRLFEVSIRLCITTSSSKSLVQRKKGIISSLSTFTNPGYQSLKAKSPVPFIEAFLKKINYLKLKYRLFSFFSNPVVSVSELSTIYHFPYTETTQTEDLQFIRSVQLPAPLSLKRAKPNLDIVFAQNIYADNITPVGLTLEERRRHQYLIGATGMGKTTLLLSMIDQDFQQGKGVAVLDPHGDLAERLLGVIPKSRINDVVYFNPYDLSYPIGLNILEVTKGLSDTEQERERDLITSSIVSIFFKLYPSTQARPRMEHILRNTILTALTTEKPTLLTAYKLLVDKKYRDATVAKLTDPILKEFWEKEFKSYGSYQRADMISPITNKLGRFLTVKTTRNILSQEENKLDFNNIMNNGKILICDLSKGKIGEDISSFLGSLIIVKLQLAALNRVTIPQDERADFFLYIDEFQNFATMTFAQILSEARKYRLNTILAHQTVSQIENKDLLKVILANVGTVIAYRTSNPSDEHFILPLFSPKVKEHQIASLPSFHFYIKINSALPQDAFTGTSFDFTKPVNKQIRKEIISNSKRSFGTKVEKLNNQEIKIEKTKIKGSSQRKRKQVKPTERKRKTI